MTAKIDQLAFYARTPAAAQRIKEQFGLQDAEWVHDTVYGRVILPLEGIEDRSEAHLQFNYDLGIELEILRYTHGLHWHRDRPYWVEGQTSFMSHVGIHVDEMPECEFPLVQEMFTQKHTNPYLLKKRRHYHYRIYDTRPLLGCWTKYIKRIEYE